MPQQINNVLQEAIKNTKIGEISIFGAKANENNSNERKSIHVEVTARPSVVVQKVELKPEGTQSIHVQETVKPPIDDTIKHPNIEETVGEKPQNKPTQKVEQAVTHVSNIKLKLNALAEVDLNPKYNRALFLTAIKNYLPLQQRLSILINIKNLSLVKKEVEGMIIKEYDEKIKNNEKIIDKYQKDTMVDTQVNKVFAPSKTATNGLNFITKDEEANLMKKEQANEILNIFRCIYIVLNENYEKVPPNKMIEYLFTNLFPKKKIENLKSLFLNVFPASLATVTQSQHEKLVKLQTENPKLLNSSDLLKLSRSVSYMTFIFKEVFDYLNMKISDGTHAYIVRTARKTTPELKEKLERLKVSINI